jgi:hypothetical protein
MLLESRLEPLDSRHSPDMARIRRVMVPKLPTTTRLWLPLWQLLPSGPSLLGPQPLLLWNLQGQTSERLIPSSSTSKG